MKDLLSYRGIIDPARPIALRRANIDEGIEFDPIRAVQIRINIDPPPELLPGTSLQEKSLFVGMEFPVDSHDLTFHINHSFHHIAETGFSHVLQFSQ